MTPEFKPVEAAFASMQNRLRSYLRKRLPDHAQIDDILQDVFLKALLSQQNGHKIVNLCGWLHTATRTSLADYYRTQKSVEPIDENLAEIKDDNFARHQELAACLSPMIEQLPTIYRDTLAKIELQGKKQAELAQAEGVSLSAIKSRAARGRKMLKQQLLDCCHISLEDGLVSDFHQRSRCECQTHD